VNLSDMHVLIIPSGHFATPLSPLGGIFQFHQANALSNAGLRVGVISPGVITLRFLFKKYNYVPFEFINSYPVYRHYVREFFPQRAIDHQKKIPVYQKLGLDLYQTYAKRFGKPDIIHAHNFEYAGCMAQAIREVEGVPYVITEHNSKFRTQKIHQAEASTLRRCSEKASALIAVSSALADAIKQVIGVNEVEIISNVVDSNFIKSPLLDLSGKREFVFFNAASLDANKNQAMLLQAFARNFKGKRVALRIAGVGPLARDLKRQAKRLRIDGQVFFLGHLDRPSVMREMQQADCFVLPSLQETFGVVLIEALAVGTPVISTRCGGPEEIVNEDNGLLVEPDDALGFGDAMVQMVKTKERYCPTNLRRACDTRFGEKAFVSSVTALYHNVL
jgi:glycosyltransferase involved in cell wall biosynthesis